MKVLVRVYYKKADPSERYCNSYRSMLNVIEDVFLEEDADYIILKKLPREVDRESLKVST